MMKKDWKGLIGVSVVCVLLLAGCGKPAANGPGQGPKRINTAIQLTDKFYDVSAVGQNVWAVGYFGAIVHSGDGGKTWTRQKPGNTEAYLSTHFLNDREGWAVGGWGTIMHTKDGGVTWEKQQSPVNDQRLLKVQFINEREGFIVGMTGVFLRTKDGGVTWERLPFSEDVILNDLYFLDSSQGWAVGEFETIIATKDGGKTFVKQRGQQAADLVGKLFGISFADPRHGIAVGTSGLTVITEDGGKTWKNVKNAVTDSLLKVRFGGPSEAIAVGLRGSVAVTEDGGTTWSPVNLPDHYTWLSGISCPLDGPWYLVGDAAAIFTSTDKGKSWMRVPLFGGP